MEEIFKKMLNKKFDVYGEHPSGGKYNHGECMLTKFWNIQEAVGFIIKAVKTKSGWVWPGVDSYEKINNGYKFFYTNAFKEKGFVCLESTEE